jgi:hypothetical protein
MGEGLQTPGGKPVEAAEVERDFARAMAADTKDASDLPRKSPDADAAKTAPKRRGRPPKAERARVISSAPAAATGAQSDAERREGVKGLVQLGAGVCALVGQQTDSVAFKADAVTLATASDPIAQAVSDTAAKNAQFARVVDKVTQAGPYAALIGVTFGVGVQIARNHGVKAAEMMGAVAPEKLLSEGESKEPVEDGSASRPADVSL